MTRESNFIDFKSIIKSFIIIRKIIEMVKSRDVCEQLTVLLMLFLRYFFESDAINVEIFKAMQKH